MEHPKYEAVNATLHARFALSSWILALQHGQSIERHLALRGGGEMGLVTGESVRDVMGKSKVTRVDH